MKRIIVIAALLFVVCSHGYSKGKPPARKPNIIYIIADQWRAQATGYSGDKNVITPNLDRLAGKSMNLKNAVSGMPVCTPHRASLLTGQYPLTTGVFMNDVMLDTSKTTIAKVLARNGYNTAFIGKWHIDGHGRKSYIPESRHQGFQYWKALECTHDYNKSQYYEGNSDTKLMWEGYDAIAETEDGCNYIRKHSKLGKPFFLLISLAPPHDPYQTAPEKYRAMYDDKDFTINENVPEQFREKLRKDLKGYYSHITALDECVGRIWKAVKDAGIEDNSIIVFTADHGDLLGAHGSWNKQQPYEESIRVPFLLHYPSALGKSGKTSSVLLNTPDIMPTLLGFSKIPVPATVQGKDLSQVILGKAKDNVEETLISCVQPFGQWTRKNGGKEYRGIVTKQYTYVRDLKGPWLLFDNTKDPFQLNNLVSESGFSGVQQDLDTRLKNVLRKRNDEFKPGMDYVKKWNYVVDETETVPYVKMNYEGKAIIE